LSFVLENFLIVVYALYAVLIVLGTTDKIQKSQ
jgi:hypothetical protein